MVIITKVLDDEVNARLSGSISNAIVEKINGVKVKGLTHAYELLYPKNMPEYVIIELKNGERPLIFEGKAMEAANKRISIPEVFLAVDAILNIYMNVASRLVV